MLSAELGWLNLMSIPYLRYPRLLMEILSTVSIEKLLCRRMTIGFEKYPCYGVLIPAESI